MVTLAVAELGTGEAAEALALDVVARLDALVDEGEPVVSAYQSQEDGPWRLDVLFCATDEAGRERWLRAAHEIAPALPRFRVDPLGSRDWVAEGQKALHPVRAGRFVVHGSHDSERLAPSQWRILIDAGRAFGTAHHASTAGCLLALERLAKRGALGSVHDVGTGAGVLAIAADRLGARPVSGGDIDPEAVRVARDNARRNRTRERIAFATHAGPFDAADTVVANILARPLIAMAPRLAAAAQRNLVLSGLRSRDRRRVEGAFLARGFALAGRIVIEDWVTIVFARRALRALKGRGTCPGASPSASRGRGRGATESRRRG